jgi:spermidine synthase
MTKLVPSTVSWLGAIVFLLLETNFVAASPHDSTHTGKIVDAMCEPGSQGCENVPMESPDATEWKRMLEHNGTSINATKTTSPNDNVDPDIDSPDNRENNDYDEEDETWTFERYYEEYGEFTCCDDYHQIWTEGGDWYLTEEAKSLRQTISVYQNEESDDSCLVLDSYLHTCASNRPHYHEVFVHYPAHFLDKVERVLFIGGGDSMVLHEVLKYKDLKKVVGLELDLQVVRTVFKEFGIQPHFDDNRVEWYFGDAAAALRVLPREYYGTFDLVVVDILTSVAEMLKVTEEYSIMEAAMLLLQPNGIIIKNEDEGYKPGSSVNFATNILDVVFHDVPLYCLQNFVVGSNGVDFTEKPPVDHGVPKFYMKEVDEFLHQFNTWYTRSKNQNFHHEEEEDDDEDEDDGVNATFPPLGLTMVIEAEHLEVPLDSSSKIQDLIAKVLQDQAFSHTTGTPSVTQLVSDVDEKLKGGYSLSFLMKEGSVVARCFPLIKYCAIDVQLWSTHLSNMNLIKNALLDILRSQQHSSFTIISSGLHNDETSSTDKNGPPQRLHTDQYELSEEDIDDDDMDSVIFFEMANATIEWRNATLHTYDNMVALDQWNSQNAIGVQSVLQFKCEFETESTTPKAVTGMLMRSLAFAHDLKLIPSNEEVHILEMDHGHIFTSSWRSGNMVAVWDGNSRIDVNILEMKQTTNANEVFEMSQVFQKKMGWSLVSEDIFPRGINGIVNFEHDYGAREEWQPRWATQMGTSVK